MQSSGLPESAVPAPPGPPRSPGPAIRVSDTDRDAVAQVLQAAFADGRLDDEEFDQRMRSALTARVAADLEQLTADLAAVAPRPAGPPAPAGRGPGKYALAYKSSIRRGGRWRVPGRFTSVVYKGTIEVSTRPPAAPGQLAGPAR